MSHHRDRRCSCGKLFGKEGEIPKGCLFLRPRSELRARGGVWDGEGTTNPIFLMHNPAFAGPAAPPEAELPVLGHSLELSMSLHLLNS